jgi:membrane protein DedA with SNARE-associated domain
MDKLKLFKVIDNALADEVESFSWRSFKVVLLTRASPLFPFPLVNYAHGVTRVSFMSYLTGSATGMIPWLTIDVYFGSLLKSLSDVNEGHSTGYLIIVGVITLITSVLVTHQVKEMLGRMDQSPVRARARWTADDGLEEVLLGNNQVMRLLEDLGSDDGSESDDPL